MGLLRREAQAELRNDCTLVCIRGARLNPGQKATLVSTSQRTTHAGSDRKSKIAVMLPDGSKRYIYETLVRFPNKRAFPKISIVADDEGPFGTDKRFGRNPPPAMPHLA